MMHLEDIKKLAELARLDMTDEEMLGMAHDFDSILGYVGQIQEVSGSLNEDKRSDEFITHNIMREDVVSNSGGEYRDDIVKQFPEKQDGYLKVKQIL